MTHSIDLAKVPGVVRLRFPEALVGHKMHSIWKEWEGSVAAVSGEAGSTDMGTELLGNIAGRKRTMVGEALNPMNQKEGERKSQVAGLTPNMGRSFVEAVRGHPKARQLKMVEVQLNSQGGVLMSAALKDKGASRWKNTLIGVVMGRKNLLGVIDQNIRRMWRKWGVTKVGSTGVGMVFIHFQMITDLRRLCGGETRL